MFEDHDGQFCVNVSDILTSQHVIDVESQTCQQQKAKDTANLLSGDVTLAEVPTLYFLAAFVSTYCAFLNHPVLAPLLLVTVSSYLSKPSYILSYKLSPILVQIGLIASPAPGQPLQGFSKKRITLQLPVTKQSRPFAPVVLPPFLVKIHLEEVDGVQPFQQQIFVLSEMIQIYQFIKQQLKLKEYRITKKRQTSLQDFQIQYKLGEGAYGFVFLASKQCQEYAIKEMSKHQLKRQHSEHLPIVQKQILRVANHPGIAKSYFAFQTSSKLYLALQLCEGGSIEDLCSSKTLSQNAKRFYIAQIVDVLEYLYRNGVVHRDLKPSNLMLSKQKHIKLIDFGTAFIENSTLVSQNFKQRLATLKGKGQHKQNIESEEQSKLKIRRRRSSFVGTSSYVCPELIQFNECEHTGDLWALGCILYYMYYGNPPFVDINELQLYSKIKHAEVVFPENKQLNQQAKDLIKKILVKCPSQRLGSCSRQELSFAALKKHPYIAKYSQSNIFEMEPSKLLHKLKNIQLQIEQISITKAIHKQENLFQKVLIKHTEDKGDIICKIKIQNNCTLEEVRLTNLQQTKIYKLSPDFENRIAHLLSDKRFSVGVQGSQRLIFTTKEAKIICQQLNNLTTNRGKFEL